MCGDGVVDFEEVVVLVDLVEVVGCVEDWYEGCCFDVVVDVEGVGVLYLYGVDEVECLLMVVVVGEYGCECCVEV